MDLQEVGWDMEWIGLVLDRNTWRAVVKAVMDVQVQNKRRIS